MNSVIFTNSLRFIGLCLLQVLVLKGMASGEGTFKYVSVILYPVFILLLPIRIPHPLLVFLGFLIGFTVDMFYDSLGVHASASVFIAFIRPSVLKALEPRGGYNINESPTKFRLGFNWFFTYACILMFLHLLFYFSMEIFTPVYLGEIIMRSTFSFIVSMIFVIIYQFIFNPRE